MLFYTMRHNTTQTFSCHTKKERNTGVLITPFYFLPHQRHHHKSQGRCQGLLGEHAKPDSPLKEGGRAETAGDILQRGHAQVSGMLDPHKF